MRRSSSSSTASLSALFATGLLAALAPTAQAQLFRRATAPPPPTATATFPTNPDLAARPSNVGRSAQHDLRNGLDYLDKYGDAARALHHFKQARTRQAELTAAERQQLADAWARAERVLDGTEQANAPIARRSSASPSSRLDPNRLPSLPPDAPALAEAIRTTPATSTPAPTGDPEILQTSTPAPAPSPAPPMVLTLESVPEIKTIPMSADGTVDLDIVVPPPSQDEPASTPAPAPQPIGLTVISDPNDYLAPAEPTPNPAPTPTSIDDSPAQPELPPAPISAPESEPATLESEPEAAPAPEPEPAPVRIDEPRDTGILLIPPPPARRDEILPPLPNDTDTSPAPAPAADMLELPTVEPTVSDPAPAPVVAESIGFTAETPGHVEPAPTPVYTPQQTDHGVLLIPPPPAQPAARTLPPLPSDDEADQAPSPAPTTTADVPQMDAPPPALPRPAAPAVAILPDQTRQEDLDQPDDDTLPAPAPAADELSSPTLVEGGPIIAPRPLNDPRMPRVQIEREETRRDIEEIARRMEQNIERNPVTYPNPAQTDDRLPRGADNSNTTALVPRTPTPSEARPIRPIPVPEAFVPFEAREFEPYRKYFAASSNCYMPLYFQDAALERYGQSAEQALGPHWGRYFSYPLDDPRQSTQRNQIIQPFYSAGLFALQIAALPYHMIMDPPWEAQYDLGYHRPGDPVPPDTIYWPKHGIGPPLQGRKY